MNELEKKIMAVLLLHFKDEEEIRKAFLELNFLFTQETGKTLLEANGI